MATSEGALSCDFCEHRCVLALGKRGRCGIRENRGGTVTTVNYGRLVALALDPIEKKPLYHFLPGTMTLSLALHGCNFSCPFCQNYSISQKEFFDLAAGKVVSPADVVNLARDRRVPSISFTYSEPTVWQDYVIETARIAKKEGIFTVMVTNGFFTEEALTRLLPLIDAFNIDIKGDETFYRTQCGASQSPVLRNIERIAAARDRVLEVTTLIIDTYHTSESIIALGKDLVARGVQVWHLSAYHPAYRSREPATDPSRLMDLYERVRAETLIPYVYLGNIRGNEGKDTRCAACDLLLITRYGFSIGDNLIKEGHCPSCRRPVYGRF